MKCSVCGAENNDTAKFCKTCGNPLKQETVQTTYSPPVNSNSNNGNKKAQTFCVTGSSKKKLFVEVIKFIFSIMKKVKKVI